jgi:Lon protease-like protein
MRKALPDRANLDHLKKQAKDLLDAHHRGDAEALARIRDAVPAFAKMTDAEIAAAPFALHDAQSAVAREYGEESWLALKKAVEARAAAPSQELLRALMTIPFPAEVGASLQRASLHGTASSAWRTLPSTLPLVPMRDALFLPNALGPIHIGRRATRAAVDAALGVTPPTVAVFAQRSAGDEEPDVAGFHPVGCEAFVHERLPDADDRAWVVIEGVRLIRLTAIDGEGDARDGYRVARVVPVTRDASDGDDDVRPLTDALRAHVRDMAKYFPDADRLLARVDAAPPDNLADLVMANLSLPVDDKARYAAEPRLVERLRIASALSGVGKAR